MFPKTKLVRDKVDQLPPRTWDQDRKIVFRKADEREYADLMAAKVSEEADEVRKCIQTKDRTGVVAELADLAEITTEVMRFYSIKPEELQAAVDQKATERGTFATRLVRVEHDEPGR